MWFDYYIRIHILFVTKKALYLGKEFEVLMTKLWNESRSNNRQIYYSLYYPIFLEIRKCDQFQK